MEVPVLFWDISLHLHSPPSASILPSKQAQVTSWQKTQMVTAILPAPRMPPSPPEVSGVTTSLQPPRIFKTASNLRLGMTMVHRGHEPDHLLLLKFFEETWLPRLNTFFISRQD